MKKIIIGSDHAGFETKQALVPFLESLGYEVKDCGPAEYNPTDDYPDYISPVAYEVSKHAGTIKGIVLGASGQGEAIVANKYPHVRAVVYYGHQLEIVELSRLHNDANILSLGAKFINIEDAKTAVKLWLETSFSEEDRHKRRLEEIENIKI